MAGEPVFESGFEDTPTPTAEIHGYKFIDAVGDGDPMGGLDLFDANRSAANIPWFNDGGGGFAAGPGLGSATSEGVDSGDLDGDGDVDVLVANNGPNQIWVNQGGAQGGTPGSFAAGAGLGAGDTRGIVVGDVDGDGDLDALASNRGAQPSRLWINQGGAQAGTEGVFVQGADLSATDDAEPALGDIDGDNDLDAVISSSGNNVVWVNQGGDQGGTEGEFVAGPVLGVGGSAAVIGDLDGDADADIIITLFSNGNQIWVNQGGVQAGVEGTFAIGSLLADFGGSAAALGDLDGDEDLDLFAANSGIDGEANEVWVNQGGAQAGSEGTFAASGQALGTANSLAVALGDLDRDGDLDAYVGNFGGANRVWVNQGGMQSGVSGTFVAGPALGSANTLGVVIADLDSLFKPPQQGVTFTLTGGDLGSPLMTVSGSQGRFSFEGLFPGNYTVTETVPAGQLSTTGQSTNVQLLNNEVEVAFSGQVPLDPGQFETVNGALMFGNLELGTIEILKLTEPTGGSGFTFSDDIEAPNSFSLDHGQSKVFMNVLPGAYTVTEDDPSASPGDYILSNLQCVDSEPGGLPSTADIPGRTANIRLDAGETVTCTFTNFNTRVGTVEIIKATNPAGGSGFTFSDTIEAPNSFGLDGGQNKIFAYIEPGTYSVSEDDPAPGFQLTGLGCIDSDGGGVPSTTNLPGRTATINLDYGETVVCTFTNTEAGTIEVTKITGPAGGSGFGFTDDIESPNSFMLDHGQTMTFANVSPGTYSVTEDDPSVSPGGFVLGNLECIDSDGSGAASTGDVPSRTATINLEPGETVSCTFTNVDDTTGTIVIDKVTDPINGRGFSFTDDIEAPNAFNLDHGDSRTFLYIFAGSYTVVENDPAPGADLTGLDCVDSDGGGAASSGDIPTRTASIELDPLETVTCTFANTLNGSIHGYTFEDADGEGDPGFALDLFDANRSTANIPWFNDGAAGFTPGPGLGSATSEGVDTADLDGDGDVDVIVANNGPNRIWVNQGGTQAGMPGDFASGAGLGNGDTRGIVVGDVDGDGDIDALAANRGSQPSRLWINQGGAQAGTEGNFVMGADFGASHDGEPALGDIDRDGDLDAVLTSGGGNAVWINQGGSQGGAEGVFTPGSALGANGAAAAIGDLDGDGDAEVVITIFSSGNQIWVNQGGVQAGVEGSFLAGALLANFGSSSAAVGDLDRDGDLDLFAANSGSSGDSNVAWINQGGIQAGTEGVFVAGPGLGGSITLDVALGDLDRDGDLDAYAGNFGGANRVWINQGGAQAGAEGTFASGAIFGSSNTLGVAIGDFDGPTTPPFSGVTFTLTGGDLGAPLMSVSGVDGEFHFAGLSPGTYTVTQTLPPGHTSSTGTEIMVTIGPGEEVVAYPGQADLVPGQFETVNYSLAFGNQPEP